tara:strand:+ start:838 stop:1707 length:870 start_codon:yes stop_codon:yes gene_type:complete
MSKGGGSKEKTVVQSTSSAPWEEQQEFLKTGFQSAQDIFDSDNPQYYDGQTTVDYSPETNTALNMTRDRALAGSPIQSTGAEQYQNTLNGDFLSGNPFFEGAFNAQVRPMVNQYMNQTAPGIDSQFNGANRMGSNAYAQTRNTADETFANALTDTAGKLAFQNYGTERGLQNAAINNSGAFASNDYLDAQRLAGVGAARESEQQSQLTDDVNRWNFDQSRDQNKLANYMGVVSGGYGTQGSSSQPVFSNTAANFLGGGAAGAGIGNMISPGGGGAAWGAGLGGLAGLLG